MSEIMKPKLTHLRFGPQLRAVRGAPAQGGIWSLLRVFAATATADVPVNS